MPHPFFFVHLHAPRPHTLFFVVLNLLIVWLIGCHEPKPNSITMGCFFFLVIDLDVIFFFCFVLCVLITLLGFSKLDFVAGQFSFILFMY